MYKFLAIFSIIIRQFFIPNPFDALGDGLLVNAGQDSMVLSPEVLNWITEPIMHVLTFAIVGLYYDRKSNSAVGSFLYLLFYCIHTLLLWLMSLTGFALWTVVLIVVIYIGCHIGIKALRNSQFA